MYLTETERREWGIDGRPPHVQVMRALHELIHERAECPKRLHAANNRIQKFIVWTAEAWATMPESVKDEMRAHGEAPPE